jgi:hypothetical protein
MSEMFILVLDANLEREKEKKGFGSNETLCFELTTVESGDQGSHKMNT